MLEADLVVIELGDRCLDVENLTRASGSRSRLDAFLDSVALRAKNEFFLGRLLKKNYLGVLPKGIVYDGSSIGWDTSYRLAEVNPEGEVKVTRNTKMICKIIDLTKG